MVPALRGMPARHCRGRRSRPDGAVRRLRPRASPPEGVTCRRRAAAWSRCRRLSAGGELGGQRSGRRARCRPTAAGSVTESPESQVRPIPVNAVPSTAASAMTTKSHASTKPRPAPTKVRVSASSDMPALKLGPVGMPEPVRPYPKRPRGQPVGAEDPAQPGLGQRLPGGRAAEHHEALRRPARRGPFLAQVARGLRPGRCLPRLRRGPVDHRRRHLRVRRQLLTSRAR